MGMFDYVEMPYGFPDAEATLVKQWQTKSLGNDLSLYRISENGRLELHSAEYDYKPLREVEPDTAVDDPLAGAQIAVARPGTETWTDQNYSGVLYIHGGIWQRDVTQRPTDWYEYEITFRDGTVQTIERVPNIR